MVKLRGTKRVRSFTFLAGTTYLATRTLRIVARGRVAVDGPIELSANAGLSIRAGHSAELREELLDGLLDLAFAIPGVVPAGITSRLAAESPVVALARPPDALARPPDTLARTPDAQARTPDTRAEAPDAMAPYGEVQGRRFAVHSWSQDADDIISEMLAADLPGRQITVVSPAAAAIALAMHRGYVAIVPGVTAAPEVLAGWLRPVVLPLPRFTARLDYLYPARHPHRDQLDAMGRAVRRAIRSPQRSSATG